MRGYDRSQSNQTTTIMCFFVKRNIWAIITSNVSGSWMVRKGSPYGASWSSRQLCSCPVSVVGIIHYLLISPEVAFWFKTSTLKLCCFFKIIAPLLCESNMLHQWSYPKQCVLGRCLPSHYRLEMSLPSSDPWGPVNETLKCRNRFVSLQFPDENTQNHRRISTRSSNTFNCTKSSWYFPINVPFFWREI